MGKIFYLHVGLHKTATTFLQDKVFPNLQDTFYKHRDEMRLSNRKGRFKGWRIDRDFEMGFTRSPAFWNDYGKDLLESTLSREILLSKKNILVSSEGIAGARIFLRNTDPVIDPFAPVNDPHLLSAHLKFFKQIIRFYGFDTLKIILTIRRQDHWLASNYAQYSHIIPKASQKDFETQVSHMIDPKFRYYWEGIWGDYLLIRNCIRDAVGENILILPIEELAKFPENYLNRTGLFLNEQSVKQVPTEKPDKNKTSKGDGEWNIKKREYYLRPFKYFKKYSPRIYCLKIGFPKSFKLTTKISDEILARYMENNRRLDIEEDLCLNKYGYY